jgi:hypothetical protein
LARKIEQQSRTKGLNELFLFANFYQYTNFSSKPNEAEETNRLQATGCGLQEEQEKKESLTLNFQLFFI